ncbi:hypothetical protein HDU97_009522 [Phlyctochytrium planicorne]|nr:hypothetical protein HDU97_009522 [Phlyctochytrium planicorne]
MQTLTLTASALICRSANLLVPNPLRLSATNKNTTHQTLDEITDNGTSRSKRSGSRGSNKDRSQQNTSNGVPSSPLPDASLGYEDGTSPGGTLKGRRRSQSRSLPCTSPLPASMSPLMDGTWENGASGEWSLLPPPLMLLSPPNTTHTASGTPSFPPTPPTKNGKLSVHRSRHQDGTFLGGLEYDPQRPRLKHGQHPFDLFAVEVWEDIIKMLDPSTIFTLRGTCTAFRFTMKENLVQVLLAREPLASLRSFAAENALVKSPVLGPSLSPSLRASVASSTSSSSNWTLNAAASPSLTGMSPSNAFGMLDGDMPPPLTLPVSSFGFPHVPPLPPNSTFQDASSSSAFLASTSLTSNPNLAIPKPEKPPTHPLRLHHHIDAFLVRALGPEPERYTSDFTMWVHYDETLTGLALAEQRDEWSRKHGGSRGRSVSKDHVQWEAAREMMGMDLKGLLARVWAVCGRLYPFSKAENMIWKERRKLKGKKNGGGAGACNGKKKEVLDVEDDVDMWEDKRSGKGSRRRKSGPAISPRLSPGLVATPVRASSSLPNSLPNRSMTPLESDSDSGDSDDVSSCGGDDEDRGILEFGRSSATECETGLFHMELDGPGSSSHKSGQGRARRRNMEPSSSSSRRHSHPRSRRQRRGKNDGDEDDEDDASFRKLGRRRDRDGSPDFRRHVPPGCDIWTVDRVMGGEGWKENGGLTAFRRFAAMSCDSTAEKNVPGESGKTRKQKEEDDGSLTEVEEDTVKARPRTLRGSASMGSLPSKGGAISSSSGSVVVLRYPATLDSKQRKAVHMASQEAGMMTMSFGEGNGRFIAVFRAF